MKTNEIIMDGYCSRAWLRVASKKKLFIYFSCLISRKTDLPPVSDFQLNCPPLSLARSHFPESLDDRRSDELALHLCTTLGIASDTVFQESFQSQPSRLQHFQLYVLWFSISCRSDRWSSHSAAAEAAAFFFFCFISIIYSYIIKRCPAPSEHTEAAAEKKNLSTTIKKRNILRWSTASCCWRPMREEGSMQKCVHISNAPTYGMNR